VVATRIQQQLSEALKAALDFGAATSFEVEQPVVARTIQQQSFAWLAIIIELYVSYSVG